MPKLIRYEHEFVGGPLDGEVISGELYPEEYAVMISPHYVWSPIEEEVVYKYIPGPKSRLRYIGWEDFSEYWAKVEEYGI